MARKRPVKRILNCVPSRETERDWRFQHADQAGLLEAPRAAAVPSSKDLRTAWWRIGDQGPSGSCVGWATADSVLRWHFVKSGKLKQNERLSPRFTWMASKETDQFSSQPTTFIEVAGTSLKAALDVARKYGSVREQVLPFSGKLFPGEEEAFYARAARYKVASYFNLSLRRPSDIDEWRRWIATKGPILTRLNVDRTWYDAGDTDGNLDVYRRNTAGGGHAVALVGYTPDRFIVRNSWGTGWGDRGFAYASLAYAQDAFTEAYGVSP
jgi:Papain family cysteine protease